MKLLGRARAARNRHGARSAPDSLAAMERAVSNRRPPPCKKDRRRYRGGRSDPISLIQAFPPPVDARAVALGRTWSADTALTRPGSATPKPVARSCGDDPGRAAHEFRHRAALGHPCGRGALDDARRYGRRLWPLMLGWRSTVRRRECCDRRCIPSCDRHRCARDPTRRPRCTWLSSEAQGLSNRVARTARSTIS
jgi:hypothetical protein